MKTNNSLFLIIFYALIYVSLSNAHISNNYTFLPYLTVKMDTNYLQMPKVEGVSQTNRCDIYYKNGIMYRYATTPEKFWLFTTEKTNLYYEAVYKGNSNAAYRLSLYYSLSLSKNNTAYKWQVLSWLLGNSTSINNLETMLEYDYNYDVFSLTENQVSLLKDNATKNKDYKSAIRLALYYGFYKKFNSKKIEWLKKADEYGSKAATHYLYILNNIDNK